MIVDKVAVNYDSLEELIERQADIEKRTLDYVQENNIANRLETEVMIYDNNKYILRLNLVKD